MHVHAVASASKKARFAALRRAIGAVLAAGLALTILHDWLGLGGPGLDSAINGVAYDAAILAAGFACLLRASRGGRERGAWMAVGAAVLAWGAAEIYWTLYIEGNPNAAYPSPADLGYLAFYPLVVAGLYALVKARAHELDRRLWMDGAIAALGTGALGAALIFEFVADRTSGSQLEVITTLAYPLGDVLLLSLVVGVVALTRWHPGRTWTLLLAGMGAMAVADVAFTLQSYEATLPGGDWVEPIYLISALFIGAEAWQPEAEPIRPDASFEGWRELVVPGIVAVAMIGLVVLQYFNGASALTTLLWSLAMLAVIGRLALSVRDNKQLLEQVRTDQLTGLGSHGRLQVDLAARCEGAGAEPVTVALFDLNGFKRYNDTFGHPAGNEMLARLGGQLREAVRPDAVAYRVGGDEFVVLIGGAEAGHAAVVKRAAEALTAKGKGYELSASWGAAKVPEEAASPAEAMQLADVRMYAQKESRRVAQAPAPDLTVQLPAGDREAVEQGNEDGADLRPRG
ncbi:MAG TPA: GGDEF domain-containing protein [Solirubrobacterales bacterium]|nr:GGDEF domain-containing protein [Solirubrobacterales bacterium]